MMISRAKFIVPLLLTTFATVASGSTLKAERSDPNAPISKPASFIVNGLLKQMDMALPINHIKTVTPGTIDPPSPAPSPEPKPSPAPVKKDPQVKSGDDFFDDDFFNSDVGFEEAKAKMQQEYEQTVEGWQKEYEETVKRWSSARKTFLQEEKKYLEAATDPDTVDATLSSTVGPSGTTVDIDSMKPGEFFIIPGSLDVPIRNQFFRGTCASFAAVRGFEVLLMQHGLTADLSEQYFYWVSKPECSETPCSNEKGGSLAQTGLKRAVGTNGVPVENDCPYLFMEFEDNETHTPLARSCFLASVSSKGYRNKVPRSDLLNEIYQGRPIVSSFRLSDNFHKGPGLVTLKDVGKYDNEMNRHSGGHAILLVGFIRLPPELNEGRYCALTANSWGEGWGVGGYGCLTEKWMAQYERPRYTALDSVEVLDRFKRNYEHAFDSIDAE